MTIKVKKLLMTVVMSMLFVTTVYAADSIPYTQVNTAGYVNCTTVVKNTSKTNALIQLTQGPVEGKCAIFVQLVRVDNTNYHTNSRLFSSCGSKAAEYGFTADTFNQYYQKQFYVKARVQSGSEYAVTTISGSVSP